MIGIGETITQVFTIPKGSIPKPEAIYPDERYSLEITVDAHLEEVAAPTPGSIEITFTYLGTYLGGERFYMKDLSVTELITQLETATSDAENYSQLYDQTLTRLESQKTTEATLRSSIAALQQEKTQLQSDYAAQTATLQSQVEDSEGENAVLTKTNSDLTTYTLIEGGAVVLLLIVSAALFLKKR